ncbi:MAG: exopolysaccharide biosynthesis protein, partial [Pseudomonadota bacterium]
MTHHHQTDPAPDPAHDPEDTQGATAFLLSLLAGLHGSSAPTSPETPPETESDTKADAIVTLGGLVALMDQRAYGFLLLLLALPCCLPFVYGLPQLVALPMLALAAQLAAGRAHPWFPARLANRSFGVAQFEGV